jgi:hypothetical protein
MRFSAKYDSIDNLPMFYWKKIHETDELKYLFVGNIECENNQQLEKLWEDIYNEFINMFGISPEYKKIKRIKIKIANLKSDYLITGDRMILNHINVEENMLKAIIEASPEGVSFREGLIEIEKKTRVKQYAKKITVADFHNYLRSK